MLLGLTEITDGEARVIGHDPVREPLAVKRRVGYLPDAVGFYDNLTAADNLRYTARLIGLVAAASAKSASPVARARRPRRCRRQARRHLLARHAPAAGPRRDPDEGSAEIAILDEPTSGLDPQATHELLEMIRNLKHHGVSVLLSSHLLERVQSVCDRVALFNEGRIVLIGTVAELGRQVLGGGCPHVDIEARGEGLAERLATVPGVRGVETTSAGLLSAPGRGRCAARSRRRRGRGRWAAAALRSTSRASR